MLFNFSTKRELKNYSLYSLGLLVSLMGTALYTFIMSLYVLKMTNSGMYFSINLAISMIPVVFVTPFAGVLADKGNKKLVVVLNDILSGLLLIGLYFYCGSNELSLPVIYLTTLILAIIGSIFDISLSAAKVNMVKEDKLVLINSTTDIISSINRILGPIIGGILFLIVDIKIFILINGLSFVFSAISEYFIDFNFINHEIGISEKTNVLEDIKKGYKYLFKREDLKSIVGIFWVINIALSLSIIVPLPYIVNTMLGLGSRYYGIIQSGFPIGIIIGALCASKLMKKYSFSQIFKYSLVGFSILIGLFGVILIPSRSLINDFIYVVYFLIVIILTGITISFVDIPIMTYIQTKIDKDYLGRVSSIVMSLIKIATLISYIISGFLIDFINVKIVVFVGSIVTIGYFIFINKNSFNEHL